MPGNTNLFLHLGALLPFIALSARPRQAGLLRATWTLSADARQVFQDAPPQQKATFDSCGAGVIRADFDLLRNSPYLPPRTYSFISPPIFFIRLSKFRNGVFCG